MKFIQVCFITASLFISYASSAAVSEAPAISLPSLHGQVNLKDYRGKVVYLDFWASWCKPCKKSFPWMYEIEKAYQSQGLQVLAVNLDKDKKQADAFLKKMNVNFVVMFDQDGNSADAYNVRGMPSSYLIGRDGKLYASHIGFREKDKTKMELAIKKLLTES